MKVHLLIFIILLSLSVGCGSRASRNEKSGTAMPHDSLIRTPVPDGQPQSKIVVQHNRSEILGEIIKINESADSSFSVVVKVLDITENTSYPSVAVKNNVYEVYPGFILDEKKKIADIQKNKSLLSLKNKKIGDKISAVIFLDGGNKWIIKDLSE